MKEETRKDRLVKEYKNATIEVMKGIANGSIKPDKIQTIRGRVTYETIIGRVTVTLPPSTIEHIESEIV
jgi:hypothetical protein